VQRGRYQHSQLQDLTSHLPTLAWTEDWCVIVNKDKSSTTLFTLSPKKQARPIKIGTHTLKEEDEATYLGVTFDKRLTWKPHTLRTEGKAHKKLAIMCKLAGTIWEHEHENTMEIHTSESYWNLLVIQRKKNIQCMYWYFLLWLKYIKCKSVCTFP